MPRYALISCLTLLMATGCDGPHEEAGERADVAAGLSDSTASIKAGPHERLGERLDQIDAARRGADTNTARDTAP